MSDDIETVRGALAGRYDLSTGVRNINPDAFLALDRIEARLHAAEEERDVRRSQAMDSIAAITALEAELDRLTRDNMRMHLLYEIKPPEQDAVARMFAAEAELDRLREAVDKAFRAASHVGLTPEDIDKTLGTFPAFSALKMDRAALTTSTQEDGLEATIVEAGKRIRDWQREKFGDHGVTIVGPGPVDV